MASRTKRVGTIGELLVAQDLVIREFDVYSSIGDNAKADLVAVRGTHTYRIQVKTAASFKNGVVLVSNWKKAGNKRLFYRPEDVDVMRCA